MSLEEGRLGRLVDARDLEGICRWVDQIVERTLSRRDERQVEVYRWVRETFGLPNANVTERAMRLFEETVELAQAEGITVERLHAVIAHVYGKPPGDPKQEVGGIGTTLLAYCEAKGISADKAEEAEFERVTAIEPEHFRRRHDLKADAGIAQRTTGRRR